MRGAQCAVVIPSCRTVTAERLSRIPEDTSIYVVCDTDAAIAAVRPGMKVFDLAFQRKVMGADYDLIPRRTSACRNFGFFYVWKHTGHEYVISIDDDVEPGEGFLDHFAHLGETRALDTACGVRWLNTIPFRNAGVPISWSGWSCATSDGRHSSSHGSSAALEITTTALTRGACGWIGTGTIGAGVDGTRSSSSASARHASASVNTPPSGACPSDRRSSSRDCSTASPHKASKLSSSATPP